MADDEKDAEAAKDDENPSAAKDEVKPEPLTLEGFADKVSHLIDEATAAGLRPLPVLATLLAKRGMGLFDQARAGAADVADRFLASLEGARAKAEKK